MWSVAFLTPLQDYSVMKAVGLIVGSILLSLRIGEISAACAVGCTCSSVDLLCQVDSLRNADGNVYITSNTYPSLGTIPLQSVQVMIRKSAVSLQMSANCYIQFFLAASGDSER